SGAGPGPVACGAGRQAHETAIRGGDAGGAGGGAGQPGGAAEQRASAAGQPAGTAGPAAPGSGTSFEPAFAADGVDELLMGFLARNIQRGNWAGLGGSLAIHADDGTAGGADWLIVSDPDAPGVSRGTGRADCPAAAPAPAFSLMLWTRGPAAGARVTGDPAILAAFGRALQITWS